MKFKVFWPVQFFIERRLKLCATTEMKWEKVLVLLLMLMMVQQLAHFTPHFAQINSKTLKFESKILSGCV